MDARQARMIFGVVMALCSVGCVGCACFDGIAPFTLVADVSNETTGEPIEGVLVFQTTKLFPSKPETEALGQSDESGHISVEGQYWFGNCWRDRPMWKTDGMFYIALEKEDYQTQQFSLRASEWPRDGNDVSVDLGEVYLKPEESKANEESGETAQE